MESNKFDKQIREKLQNLKADYKPEDWELMEQKLDGAGIDANPEFEDVLLDGIAFGSLENYEAEFDPNHWELMEQKLDDQTYPLRQKLYRYKIAEVGLMLLAIFTLIQFLPFKKQKISKDTVVAEQQFSNTESFAMGSIAEGNLNNENSASQSQTNNLNVADATIIKDNTLVSATEAPSTTERESNTNSNTTTFNSLILKDEQADNSLSLDVPEIEINNSFSKKYLDLSVATPLAFNAEEKQSVSLLLPINTHKLEQLSVANYTNELPECPSCNDLNTGVLLSVGMMGGIDADYIRTPFDDEYHQNEFGQISMGYGGGITLGFRYHKWELETGAIYASKNYGSRNIFEINGSFSDGGYVKEGLLDVQLDIVRVPLHLRYNFMNQSKWNIYAHSGASFNVTVETLYEYTSHSIGNSNALANRRGNPHPSKTYKGVFEGGDLIDNTFITANLGVGVERYFNSRMSIFLGSTYQHQITKGIGPQNDKINSRSIMTGARVTLKSNKK